jgi:hypothetical protein
MKILNLYAGIGGNRAQWGTEHEVTAVEYDPLIAEVYHDLSRPTTMSMTSSGSRLRARRTASTATTWASRPRVTRPSSRR